MPRCYAIRESEGNAQPLADRSTDFLLDPLDDRCPAKFRRTESRREPAASPEPWLLRTRFTQSPGS